MSTLFSYKKHDSCIIFKVRLCIIIIQLCYKMYYRTSLKSKKWSIQSCLTYQNDDKNRMLIFKCQKCYFIHCLSFSILCNVSKNKRILVSGIVYSRGHILKSLLSCEINKFENVLFIS